MRLRIFGVRVLCTVPFCVLITSMLLMDVTGYMLLSLLAVTWHELGHLAVMWRLRSAPTEVQFSVWGISMFKAPYTTQKQEVWVAAAGPAANLLFALICLALYYFWPNERLAAFGAIHLVVAAFNLLPVKGLDGGTLLLALLQRLLGDGQGQKIFSALGIALAGCITAAGVNLLFLGGRNLSLLCIGVYLLILNIFKI